MSFSASTCLTNIGTTPLGTTLSIYSNPESPTIPGTYVTNVPTTDITGGNCPYTFEVPDGTTSIRLSDPTTGCYCDIPISDNNLCTTCDLNFNYFEPVTVGNIVAGDLTGTCTENITDYIINWYETGDTVNAVFTSGKGTDPLIGTYDYVHPLTGATSVLAPSGYYEAIIQKIKINGVVFSVTGGTGTVLADLDCLPSISNGNPIQVESLTCSNGGASSDLPQYEHRFDYDAGTGGKIPIGLSTTFEFSANTNFFVWKFKGNEVPDKIKLTFSGSSYDVPLVLDYWEVGGTLNVNNFNSNVFPKSADTSSFFSKATCLTGLTVNAGDNLFIEITPSTANTQTSWTFYCSCLDTFDCTVCTPPSATTVSGTTSYQYPISASTITGITTNPCGTIVQFKLITESCPYSGFVNTDFSKYIDYQGYPTYSNYSQPITTPLIYNNNTTCSTGTSGYTGQYTCLNLGVGNSITYEKSPGLFKVTSNNQSIIYTYFYNQYLLKISPYISPSYSADSTNIEYYRYFPIYWPNSTGTTQCGDGTVTQSISIHQTSVVTTGTSGSDYYISFTLPTISDNISFSSCDLNCDSYVSSIVSSVNDSSTGSSYNYTGTTTVGSIYDKPIYGMVGLTSQTSSNPISYQSNSLIYYYYQNDTIPASGSSYTLIPSLSASTCPNINDDMTQNSIGYYKTYYYYTVELFDVLDNSNFRIYSISINDKGLTNSNIKTLVYEWSGGTNTYSNPEYLV